MPMPDFFPRVKVVQRMQEGPVTWTPGPRKIMVEELRWTFHGYEWVPVDRDDKGKPLYAIDKRVEES